MVSNHQPALIRADYEGLPKDARIEAQGLAALELDPYRDVALVYAPAVADRAITQAIISHCENLRFRFAVIDCPKEDSSGIHATV